MNSLWLTLIIITILIIASAFFGIQFLLNKQKIQQLEEQLSRIRDENSRLKQYRQDADIYQRQMQSLSKKYSALEVVKNNLEDSLKLVTSEYQGSKPIYLSEASEKIDTSTADELRKMNQNLHEDLEMLNMTTKQVNKDYQALIARLQLKVEALEQERLEISLELQKKREASNTAVLEIQGQNIAELEKLEAENQKLIETNEKLFKIIMLQKKKMDGNSSEQSDLKSNLTI